MVVSVSDALSNQGVESEQVPIYGDIQAPDMVTLVCDA